MGSSTASLAEYPYNLSTAAFQLVMVPSRVLPMIASLEDWTIAVNQDRTSSSLLLCAWSPVARGLVSFASEIMLVREVRPCPSLTLVAKPF